MDVNMDPIPPQDSGTLGNEELALQGLLSTIDQLEAEPDNLPLLREHLRLARETAVPEYISRALEMLVDASGAAPTLWLEVLERFDMEELDQNEGRASKLIPYASKACHDYLSIPVLRKVAEVLIKSSSFIPTSLNIGEPSEAPQPARGLGLLSEEQARSGLREACKMADFDISRSHLVWDIYRDWEETMLQVKEDSERPAAIEQLHRIYIDRLATVHATHSETSQAYSTFNSTASPENYEANMVKATKASTKSTARWEAREMWEQGYSAILAQDETSLTEEDLRNQKMGYLYPYLEMELNPEGGKKPEAKMVQGIFERYLEVLGTWTTPEGKQFEASTWEKYGSFMATTNGISKAQVMQVWQRAARCCPGSGQVWSRLMRAQEMAEQEPAMIGETYMKALALGELTRPQPKDKTGKAKGSVASAALLELITLEVTWASFLRRMSESRGGDEASVTASLRSAIERCRRVDSRVDPMMKLEKYLISWLERKGEVEEALEVWDSLSKQNGKSYQFWLDYTNFAVRTEEFNKARSLFKIAASRPAIDWPESIWEAWITFEEFHGSATQLETAKNKISNLQDGLARKRRSEADAQAQRTQPSGYQASEVAADTIAHAMDIDEVPEPSRKRKAEDVTVDEVKGKRTRFSKEADRDGDTKPAYRPSADAPTRDREHCTVMVSGLARGTPETAVRQRFSDCGVIREVVVTDLEKQAVATVEFESVESVPAALTKDKKIIVDSQVNVYVAWNSTLYVTNFPEKADDTYIRELFQPFGELLITRWPSKKFKTTRRFVYVQFVDPASAQEALALHGKPLEPGRSLTVYLSDPDRKKDRTDAHADDRELYISQLSKFVTEANIRKLFEQFGAIKRIKVVEGDDGHCRGFAFLEFETSEAADNALRLDQTDYKHRRMSVKKAANKEPRQMQSRKPVITDAVIQKSTDILNRSLRLKGLPRHSQEGLLQQAVEKVAPVRAVEIFQDSQQAAVELQDAADMVKFLLRKEPFIFEGAELKIEAESDLSQHSTLPKAVAAAAAAATATPPVQRGVPDLMPRPPKRSGAKKRLGLGAGVQQLATASSSTTAPPAFVPSAGGSETAAAAGSAAPKGQDDFRKMLLEKK